MNLSAIVSAAAGVIPLRINPFYFAVAPSSASRSRFSGVAKVKREARKLRNQRGQKVQIQMIKQPGGLLLPASDADAERLERFKSGAMYQIDIKQPRNPAFHGKVFAFMSFCLSTGHQDRPITGLKPVPRSLMRFAKS